MMEHHGDVRDQDSTMLTEGKRGMTENCDNSTVEEKGEEIKYTNIEDIIDAIGGFGQFQMTIILATTGSWIVTAATTMLMAFGAKEPDWWCLGKENGDDILNTSRWDSTYQQCTDNGTECRNIVFDESMVTIVSEFELVCDRTTMASTITTTQMIGLLIGSVVMAQVSDSFGRKYLLFGSILVQTLMNVLSAVVNSWSALVACRFFIGLALGGLSATSVVLSMEFTGKNYRYLITMIPYWLIGETLFGLLAYTLEDYRHICFATAAMGVPFLMSFLFVPESLRWLVTQSRTKEAAAIVQRIARINGKQCPPLDGLFDEIVQTHKIEESKKKYTYRDLLSSWVIFKKLAVFMFISFTLGTSYYALAFGLPELAGNIYINLILSGVVALPASPIGSILMHKFGRRFVVSLIGVTGLCATTIVALKLAKTDSVLGDRAIVACVVIGKGMLEFVWNGALTLQMESFPTVIRSLACGASNTCGRLGGIFGPALLYLKFRDGVAMYIVVAVLTFVGSGVVWLIPETRGAPLADHIQLIAQDNLERKRKRTEPRALYELATEKGVHNSE